MGIQTNGWSRAHTDHINAHLGDGHIGCGAGGGGRTQGNAIKIEGGGIRIQHSRGEQHAAGLILPRCGHEHVRGIGPE